MTNAGDIAVIQIGARLDEAAVAQLAHALEAAANARVIVLEGAPEQFCLGMDFPTILAADRTPHARLVGFSHVVHALATAPCPTLAVVDGPAIGGGLGLASACDVVIASERATFALPEALYGLAPAVIAPVLLARISAQALRALVMTCHSRTAAEARLLGLVDEVVPVDALATTRARLIRQLRRASRGTVATLRRWDSDELARRLAAGVEDTAAALGRPEVRAALAQEEPPWL